MVDFFTKGGIFMYPILLCSITALAIFIERLWNLRWKHVIPQEFISDVELLIRREKIPDAALRCQQKRIGYMKIPPLVKKSTISYLIDLMSAIYLSFSVIAIAWGGHGTGAVKPVCGRSSTGADLKHTVIL